jgi:hypothetical protein
MNSTNDTLTKNSMKKGLNTEFEYFVDGDVGIRRLRNFADNPFEVLMT